MKISSAVFALFASFMATYAAAAPLDVGAPDLIRGGDSFQSYQISPCQYWMPSRNGLGYVCQNMPMFIQVPQADSIADVLKAHGDRIAALEKKIEELSHTCK